MCVLPLAPLHERVCLRQQLFISALHELLIILIVILVIILVIILIVVVVIIVTASSTGTSAGWLGTEHIGDRVHIQHLLLQALGAVKL